MNKNIAVLSCSNGLGHIRRSLILSNELIKLGFKPHLFAPIKKIKILLNIYDFEKLPQFIDFNCCVNYNFYQNNSIDDYHKKFPELSKFRFVISDNLIEVLKVRPDAILLGSFFWHKVIINLKLKKFDYFESLLSLHKPKIIASKIFAPEYIESMENYIGVGLYHYLNKQKKDISLNKKILISRGTGGLAKEKFDLFIKELKNYKKTSFEEIFVERNIDLGNVNQKFSPATFSNEMYQKISCAVIRPGIGTVTDALFNKVKVFFLFEENNLEMISNAKKLELAGLTKNFYKNKSIIDEIIKYINNQNEVENYKNKIKKIDFSGAYQTAKLIAGL